MPNLNKYELDVAIKVVKLLSFYRDTVSKVLLLFPQKFPTGSRKTDANVIHPTFLVLTLFRTFSLYVPINYMNKEHTFFATFQAFPTLYSACSKLIDCYMYKHCFANSSK